MSDISLTPSSVIASGKAAWINGTAGETINAGQIVYLDEATNRVKLADSDASAAAAAAYGMALNNAYTGQPVRICTRDPELRCNYGNSPGLVMVLSATIPGSLASIEVFNDPRDAYRTVLAVGVGLGVVSFRADRRILTPAITRPAAPTDLALSAATSSTLTFGWTLSASSNITRQVLRLSLAGSPFTVLRTDVADNTSDSIEYTGLAADTSHRLQLVAVAGGLESEIVEIVESTSP